MCVDWLYLAHDKDKCATFVNNELSGSMKSCKCLECLGKYLYQHINSCCT